MTKLFNNVVHTSPFSKHAPTFAEAMSTQSYTVPQDLELSSSVHTFRAVYVCENSVHVGDCVKYFSQGEYVHVLLDLIMCSHSIATCKAFLLLIANVG